MLKPIENGRFRFACHPGVPCFTECCRELKLMLTPYDILRLKNRLSLNAGEFLETYAEKEYDEHRHLPMIFLKMRDDDRKTCPFVSPQGCQVYEDRPAACRIYPVARASRVHRLHGMLLEDFFVLQEPHCQGFDEDREWSIKEWTGDQGLVIYHEFNDTWMQIITHPRITKGDPLSEKQQQMFFLAAYNLDRFREFVLGSRFLQLFEFTAEEKEAFPRDDARLLELAFRWLRFSLFNDAVLKTRNIG
jgi:Fe-S-cluster containining protein